MPRLHHVGLNSVDPARAIEWYLEVWPSARKTEVAGYPGVQSDMLLLFNKVSQPPAGAWRDDLHRAEPQSAFWHIGAMTNTTDIAARLQSVGITHLPLFTSPTETKTVWRSGLAPYAGTLSLAQLATATPAPPRDGGFSYVAVSSIHRSHTSRASPRTAKPAGRRSSRSGRFGSLRPASGSGTGRCRGIRDNV